MVRTPLPLPASAAPLTAASAVPLPLTPETLDLPVSGEVAMMALFSPLNVFSLIIGLGVLFFTLRYKPGNNGAEEGPAPRGVSGWLLFFILNTGLGLLLGLFFALQGLAGEWALPVELARGLRMFSGFQALFLSANLYALYRLWAVRAGAVRLNRLFLWLHIAAVIAFPLLRLASMQAFSGRDMFTPEFIGLFFPAGTALLLMAQSVSSGVWIAYLSRSRRVKNTWEHKGLPW